MKRIALTLALAALALPATASAEEPPDRYAGQYLNASLDLVYGFAGGRPYNVKVEGKFNRCERIRTHAWECPFRVDYKLERGDPWSRCFTNVVLPRKGWTWPGRANRAPACPPEWLPGA